jgi:serine/threonine-protein kinase
MKKEAARQLAASEARLQCTGGEYRIYDPIGVGGMASVHLARFLGAGGFARTVAVKRPLPALQASAEFRCLAWREALLAARIHHPHVVATLDVVDADGELWIVMEYVAGEPLSALLEQARRRGERIPLPVVSALVGGALRGLEAVHGARDERGQPLGMIHRDVSPQNILVGVDGLARLADFGLARATSSAALSDPAEFKGKLTYASPEQVELRGLTPATDIYSIGVVSWELLTGQRLYRDLTTPELVSRLLAGRIPPPSQVVPELPESIDGLVMRALSRDPAERQHSALEMAGELEDAVRAASLEEVAGWLRELASESIERRTRLVIAAESDTAPSQHSGALAASVAGTSGGAGAARSRDARARASSVWVAASWRVMALGVGASAAWWAGDRLLSRPEAPRQAERALAPLPDEPAPAVRQQPQSAGAAGAVAAPALAGARPALEAASVAPPVPPERVPTPPAVPAKRRAPAPDCSPPFSLDSQGVRHMKPGCQ